MPTYEYVCDVCGHEFELFQSMTDPVKRKCPQCEKLALRRLIGRGSAIIFKGSGFYQTDYRSDSYKKAAEAEGGKAKKKKKAGSNEGTKAPKKDSDGSGATQ